MPLATLNPSRLELLIQRYLAAVEQQAQREQQQQEAGGAAEAQEQQQPDGTAEPRRQPWCMAYGQGPLHQQQQQQAAALGRQVRLAGVSLPTPSELAPHDPVFHVPWLHVGTPLAKLVRRHGPHLAEVVQRQQRLEERQRAQQAQEAQQTDDPPGPQQLHLLVPDGAGGMHLLLHEQAESADCILGFLHAYLVQECCSCSGGSGGCGSAGAAAEQQPAGAAAGPTPEQLAYSLEQARQLLPGLLAALEAAGWDDQKVVLEAKRRRVSW